MLIMPSQTQKSMGIIVGSLAGSIRLTLLAPLNFRERTLRYGGNYHLPGQ